MTRLYPEIKLSVSRLDLDLYPDYNVDRGKLLMSLVQTRARPSRTHFHKTYCLSDLLDPMEQIRLRVDQIQTLSAQFSLIPEVEFEWTGSSLIYRQAKVRRRDS